MAENVICTQFQHNIFTRNSAIADKLHKASNYLNTFLT